MVVKIQRKNRLDTYIFNHDNKSMPFEKALQV